MPVLVVGSRQSHALLAAYADQVGDRCPLLLPTEAAAMETGVGRQLLRVIILTTLLYYLKKRIRDQSPSS
jgi:hypothetical protein